MGDPTPLNRLLVVDHEADQVVAWRRDPEQGQDRPLRWSDLRRQIAGLVRSLDQTPQGPWILACNDGYAFAVGLLALWHSGRCAIAPPNTQPSSLEALSRRETGLISDRPELAESLAAVSPELRSLCPADPAEPGLSHFRSWWQQEEFASGRLRLGGPAGEIAPEGGVR
jgi:hypothetical protein